MENGGGMAELARMWRCRRGVTSIEYAILAAIMVVMLVGVLEVLGPTVADKWSSLSTSVTSASGSGQ